MDPSHNTDSFLADIHSESLLHFLSFFRCNASLPLKTHIPAIDEIIGAPSDTNTSRNSASDGLRRADIVEIHGPSASGKSHLVYHLTTTCILPMYHCQEKIDGWGKAAIVFDVDGSFSIHRLRQLLRSRVSHARLTHRTSEHLDQLVDQCLQRLHVLRPVSTTQLATSLLQLPAYLSSHPCLRQAEIGLLAFDPVMAYHWVDRHNMEHMRRTHRDPLLSSPFQLLARTLSSIQFLHIPLIVFTSCDLSSSPRASSSNTPPRVPLGNQTVASLSAPPPQSPTRSMVGHTLNAITAPTSAHAYSQPSQEEAGIPVTIRIVLEPCPSPQGPSVPPVSTARTQECKACQFSATVHPVQSLPGEYPPRYFSFSIDEGDIVLDCSSDLTHNAPSELL